MRASSTSRPGTASRTCAWCGWNRPCCSPGPRRCRPGGHCPAGGARPSRSLGPASRNRSFTSNGRCCARWGSCCARCRSTSTPSTRSSPDCGVPVVQPTRPSTRACWIPWWPAASAATKHRSPPCSAKPPRKPASRTRSRVMRCPPASWTPPACARTTATPSCTASACTSSTCRCRKTSSPPIPTAKPKAPVCTLWKPRWRRSARASGPAKAPGPAST